MSASRLPLPLELTKPVLLAGDVDTLVRAGYGSSTYDPKTQLCSYADGTSSEQNCESTTELLVIDINFDGIVIDDIPLLI
jgi:hypothetical protein